MPKIKSYARRIGSCDVYQFVMRVPTKVVEKVRGATLPVMLLEYPGEPPAVVQVKIGTFVKFSLRTTNPNVANVRASSVLHELQKFFESAVRGPQPLTPRQTAGLAGRVYNLFTDAYGDNPGTPDQWAAWKAFNRAAGQGRIIDADPITMEQRNEVSAAEITFGSNLTAGIDALPQIDVAAGLESRFGAITNWVLNQENLSINSETRQTLLANVFRAAQFAGFQLKRNADGDFSPDAAATRFPPFERYVGLTFIDLFEKYVKESQPASSTVSTWRGVASSVDLFFKRKDIRRVTDIDAIRWKDALVEGGHLSQKTIADSYVASMRAIMNYGMKNNLVQSNPFAKLKLTVRKIPGTGRLAYPNDEVAKLLSISKQQVISARRWLPWLAATSGARIAELAQLWVEEIKFEDGIHFMQIKPAEDGGSVKNLPSERPVPIHNILIADGFLEFAKGRGKGPLFYGKSSGDPNKRHASKGVTNRLAAWIRAEGFTNKRIDPSHGLRHWWKTAAHNANVPDALAKVIQGQTIDKGTATYYHFSLKHLNDAINAISVPIET